MTRRTARIAGFSVALTLVLLALGGVLYLYSGAYDVAATREHTALGRWILGTTQERSVAVRVEATPAPPPFDASLVEHGAEHYRSMCVVCHGAPGVERGDVGRGMTPTPPSLAEESGEWSARELFWITKHGIKLAGMPAFGPTHSDREIWGLVAFLEEMEGMTPMEYVRWDARSSDDAQGGASHTHEPAADAHSH